jgi:predicted ATPase
MSHLSLLVLGAPAARHAGQALAFPTRKAMALLVYLAVEGGVHTREKITALFWPESDSERGRAALRRTLVQLRDTLDDVESHLRIERDSLAFDFSSDSDLDLQTLQSAFAAARAVPRPIAQRVADLPHLQLATSLYRGDFLEGFSLSDAPAFDEWASLQREVWHRRISLVFDRLSQWQSEGGELTGAIDVAARWVKHDALNETAHRRLMQLHLAVGNRAAALQAYQSYRALLERELKAEPSPDTEALAERIRFQIEAPSPDEMSVRGFTGSASAIEAPLVGRMNEHTELVTAYRTARRGRPQAVTIEGEPGIGKTRLASEFLRWAAAQGATVLQGRAFETSGRLPYQPIVEALRGMLVDLDIVDVSPTWLAELSRMLPELRDRHLDLPDPPVLGEAEAQTRWFEAVARLGQALAEHAPAKSAVFFVDDLQWTDAASLDLLHYAARRWTADGSPLLLVFTLRSEDLSGASGLADWLVSLGRAIPVTRLSLGPLTAEDTVRLIESLANFALDTAQFEPARDFGQQLFAETGGQPFFIIESLKALLEMKDIESIGEIGLALADAVARRESPSPHMPAGVRQLILSRLNRLSPAGLTICMAGAVLGHRFDFESLCRVAGVEDNTGLLALDDALRRGLLRESVDQYLFAHDQIREVAYAEAGEARRRVFHHRALEALKAVAPPAELVRHALAAGLTERAFHLSLSAGDEAMRLFAARDALRHYEQARALAANLPREAIAAAESHLYMQLGRACELNDERERARAMYLEMLGVARKTGQPTLECAALNRLATVTQHMLDFESAQALLHSALAVAETSGDKMGLAETEWNLAQLGHHTLQLDESLAHGERALMLARELDSKELIARSLNALALSKLEMGRWAETEAHGRESAMLYAVLGNRALEADSLALKAEAQIRSGQAQAGLTSARTAHAIAVEIQNTWGQANTAQQVALALLELGEYSEALKTAQAGVAAARIAGFDPLTVFNLTVLGGIYRALLALEAALATHKEAYLFSQGPGGEFFAFNVTAELCADCALAGEWTEALAYAQQVIAAVDQPQFYVGLTRWHITEALLRAGEVDSAAEDIRRFGEQIGDDRRYRIPYLRGLAVLAQSRGETEQAVTYLQESATLSEDLGLPGEQWQIYEALNELHRLRGDEERARECAARATEIIQSLAAKIDDERLRTSFLEALDVRR